MALQVKPEPGLGRPMPALLPMTWQVARLQHRLGSQQVWRDDWPVAAGMPRMRVWMWVFAWVRLVLYRQLGLRRLWGRPALESRDPVGSCIRRWVHPCAGKAGVGRLAAGGCGIGEEQALRAECASGRGLAGCLVGLTDGTGVSDNCCDSWPGCDLFHLWQRGAEGEPRGDRG